MAGEDSTLPLPNMVIELRDAKGTFITSQHTDQNGNYVIPAGAGKYYAVPIPDRTWNASPLDLYVTTASAKANFSMRGVPVDVTVTGQPGWFVLVTTYPTTVAPEIYAGAPLAGWSRTIEEDGKTIIELPALALAYLTCWELENLHFVVKPSNPINGGNPLHPLQHLTEHCP